ncbi:MAG TPA: hypothetical protein DIT76_00600 [Spartobacteria bacterium]|jgi:hypothetical protein|nr:hypothetical protein [Spartobacteria bacterium]HCP90540.1 hypothetical protein [Spartobacteria bacterium]
MEFVGMNLACKIAAGGALAAIVLLAGYVIAADPPKKEARVTQIIHEVKLLPFDAPPRPAAENEQVSENTAVRTGDESRSELTFEDLTITRLGANTIFSFNKAGRSGRLDSGSILLRVPKDSGGAEFRTRAVTVGITGTTVIFESTRLGNSKLITLEGGARLTLIKHPKEFADVRAGQMLSVKAGATKLPAPEDVDLDQIIKTHPLLTDFPPLPSQDLILAAIKNQQARPPGAPPPGQGKPSTTGGPTAVPVVNFTPVVIPPPRGTPPPSPIVTTTSTAQPIPPPNFTPRPSRPPKRTPTPTVSPTRTRPPQALPTRTPRPKPKATTTSTTQSTSTPPVILRQAPRAGTQLSQGNVLQPPSRAVKGFKKLPTPTPTAPVIR